MQGVTTMQSGNHSDLENILGDTALNSIVIFLLKQSDLEVVFEDHSTLPIITTTVIYDHCNKLIQRVCGAYSTRMNGFFKILNKFQIIDVLTPFVQNTEIHSLVEPSVVSTISQTNNSLFWSGIRVMIFGIRHASYG